MYLSTGRFYALAVQSSHFKWFCIYLNWLPSCPVKSCVKCTCWSQSGVTLISICKWGVFLLTCYNKGRQNQLLIWSQTALWLIHTKCFITKTKPFEYCHTNKSKSFSYFISFTLFGGNLNLCVAFFFFCLFVFFYLQVI